LLALSAAATAAAGLAACGGGKGDGGAFTDCAKIGRLTRVTDPPRDQAGRIAGVPEEPQADLIAVGIARSRRQLCVEYTARTKIKPAAAYLLVLRPQRAERPIVQLEATVFAAQAPKALLNAGERGGAFRNIPAKVGLKDNHISVVVDRTQFARARIARVYDAFTFQARTAAITKDGGHVTDCAPQCS
jgi:hypothetical protein